MKYIFIVIFIFCGLAAAVSASAATMLLERDVSNTRSGLVWVNISLRPDGDRVTALAGKMILSGNARVSEIRDGDSIISAWIERPSVVENSIRFSGIIPGGFYGTFNPYLEGPQPGVVLAIGLEGDAGAVEMSLRELEAYGGIDGSIAISLATEPLQLNFSETQKTTAGDVDTYSPADFIVEILKFPETREQLFAVFSARDSESGIDHFEIQETEDANPNPALWQKTETPYLLKDQTRSHYLFVKAIDRQGNESIKRIDPVHERNYWWWILLVVLLVIVPVLIRLRRKV